MVRGGLGLAQHCIAGPPCGPRLASGQTTRWASKTLCAVDVRACPWSTSPCLHPPPQQVASILLARDTVERLDSFMPAGQKSRPLVSCLAAMHWRVEAQTGSRKTAPLATQTQHAKHNEARCCVSCRQMRNSRVIQLRTLPIQREALQTHETRDLKDGARSRIIPGDPRPVAGPL